jgi:predicted house-cleaning NTP pyrophosphatase (Maf/HAM1 superfamily)
MQQQANVSVQHIEDTMMAFYLKTREQTDTAGMAAYMRQHLSGAEYQLWLQDEK